MLCPDDGSGFQILGLFIRGQDAVAVVLAGQHFHPRQKLLNLAPFHRQLQHSPQDLQAPVDAGNRQLGLPPLRNEAGDLVGGDRVGPRSGRREFSAPISHGNWRSRSATASAAVSSWGAGISAGFGAACNLRIRRLRAWAHPPRAPIIRHWSIVLLNRIRIVLSFRMTIH
jgi:hypothetical protein